MTVDEEGEETKIGIETELVEEGARSGGRGSAKVYAAIVDVVSAGIVIAAHGTGSAGTSVPHAVAEVLRSAARNAVAADTDLAVAAKAMMVGAVLGTREKEPATLATLTDAARIIILETSAAGGDVSQATRGVILGARASAKAVKVESGRAATAAARGAVEGGELSGPIAAEKVREALNNLIGGIRVVLPDPVVKVR